MTLPGTLRTDDDRRAVRFERLYDATPEELWAALTDPEQIRGWLAHATRWSLETGEAYELAFDDSPATGRIRSVEPGRVLELDWNYPGEDASVVRLEVVPRERGTLLVLDHTRLDQESAPGYAAGWQSHLEALELLLGGGDPGSQHDWWARYEELRPSYVEEAAALP